MTAVYADVVTVVSVALVTLVSAVTSNLMLRFVIGGALVVDVVFGLNLSATRAGIFMLIVIVIGFYKIVVAVLNMSARAEALVLVATVGCIASVGVVHVLHIAAIGAGLFVMKAAALGFYKIVIAVLDVSARASMLVLGATLRDIASVGVIYVC